MKQGPVGNGTYTTIWMSASDKIDQNKWSPNDSEPHTVVSEDNNNNYWLSQGEYR